MVVKLQRAPLIQSEELSSESCPRAGSNHADNGHVKQSLALTKGRPVDKRGGASERRVYGMGYKKYVGEDETMRLRDCLSMCPCAASGCFTNI